MGRDSPAKYHKSSRDRSPERRRRSRSNSRERDRKNRRRSPERRGETSKYTSSRREVKEEVRSDEGSRSPRRRENRRNDDRDRRRSRSPRNRGDTENQRRRNNDEGKKYGLERKIKEEEVPEQQKWGKPQEAPKFGGEEGEEPKEKKKVDLGVSGLLTEDTNTFKGVVIKYNEPPEAKKPNARWRLYPFKGEEALKVLYIHRQSAYLIGRDHKIADIPVDHPSCSKQHAVLQYRSMPFMRDDGTRARRIVPYIIDLGSANGTFLNEQRIEAQRYVEIQDKDMLKFGFSTREYVVMKEREIGEEELAEGGGGGGGDGEDLTPE